MRTSVQYRVPRCTTGRCDASTSYVRRVDQLRATRRPGGPCVAQHDDDPDKYARVDVSALELRYVMREGNVYYHLIEEAVSAVETDTSGSVSLVTMFVCRHCTRAVSVPEGLCAVVPEGLSARGTLCGSARRTLCGSARGASFSCARRTLIGDARRTLFGGARRTLCWVWVQGLCGDV
eukprot:COSAG01_NODE_8175_length_2890_cov_28.469366_3_plen_178_part_00